MTDWVGKRYWLVGASDGLGAALARRMSLRGASLVLSARSEDKLTALAAELPGRAEVQPVDISDSASVSAAAQAIGDIDGVVFLAGVYWPVSSKDWQADEVTAMSDINFTGLARVLGATVPAMVDRDRGHIVITGSLSGFRGLPGAMGYAASKAGTMAMAECLYADLHRTNVRVQLANPGYIRTRLTEKNEFRMPYIMEPDKAAQIMMDHMETEYFERSFPTGFSLVFRLSRFLPSWLYYRLFA